MQLQRRTLIAIIVAVVIVVGGGLFLIFRGGSGGYQIDGKVTPGEAARSIKSERFFKHAPGEPPPVGDPATLCYIGRTDSGGKPSLYVAFVCSDPQPGRIMAEVRHNLPFADNRLMNDDSVEIFLDPENDRDSYYQMIINSRGCYSSAAWPSKKDYVQGISKSWNPKPVVKTSVNNSGWTCELLIPFETMGGAPAKGSIWAVNFCRNFRGQKPEGQRQSWYDVYGNEANFHNIKDFGVITW